MKTEPIAFGRPWIEDAERNAVQEVLGGSVLTHGPRCKEFEQLFADFVGAPSGHCLAVSSGMGALHLAMLALGIGPDDEVIVAAQTHTATAHAVEVVGARPVFVDCEPLTGNIEATAIAAAVTERTRAVALVHFVGIACDMAAIMEVARAHDLKVVEDCALAIGAHSHGAHVGLNGDAGCFSFYPAKHITTGEGGMLISRHTDLIARAAKLQAFGVDRSYDERVLPGLYDVPTLGLNYRMSEIAAAIGIHQVARLGEILDRRRSNFERLRHLLDGQQGIRVLDAASPQTSNSHYCLSAALSERHAQHRNAVVAQLRNRGIGSSIYYPHPVPRLKYYQAKYGYDDARYPNAAMISDETIALPVGPHLAAKDVERIGAELLNALEGLNS